jgi:hypothetical protein
LVCQKNNADFVHKCFSEKKSKLAQTKTGLATKRDIF